jgi:cellulose synthase/poly-beta-1,6-N-acetylglucosamine synthase-like glycosyltransferase
MIYPFIITLLKILELIVFIYFALGTLYFTVFSFAGLFPYHKIGSGSVKKRKFAVFIPGYKEDAVIIDIAKQALNQDYPRELYDVIIIADSFQSSTLEILRTLPIHVIEVVFEKSSKSRALNKAMSQIDKNYDSVIILDADNIMEHHFITRMNRAMNNGFVAVQGHRTAKNRNTSFAILDSVSEEINNHIFRKGHRVLGLSSALIGSGMAFDYTLFKSYMASIDSFGEDKELEIKLLLDRHRIEYCEEAVVFDEKVQKSKVFMVQRTRWLANQLIYARHYFFLSLRELILRHNLDLFDKVIQQFLPPRIFLLGFLVILSIISGLVNSLPFALCWIGITALSIITLLISIPKQMFTLETFKATWMLPKGFVFMIFSLFRISKAKRGFGATSHSIAQKQSSS